MKKYFLPLFMLAIFETVAITLWLTQNNIFYLFNFSYIGISISLGMFLYVKKIQICSQNCTAFSRALYVGLFRVYFRRKYADRGILVLSFHRCYLKLQQFIMRWLKFLDRCFLA